VLYTLVFFIG